MKTKDIQIRKDFKNYVSSSKFMHISIERDNRDSFDCATFVNYVFKNYFNFDILYNGYGKSWTTKIMTSNVGRTYNIDENLTTTDKIKILKENARVGDVLFFHRQSLDANGPKDDNYYPGHVGIYLGNDKFIDARWNRGNIAICSLKQDIYSQLLCGYKDFISQIYENSFNPPL